MLFTVDKSFLIFAGSVIALCVLYIIFVITILPSIRKKKFVKTLKLKASENNKEIVLNECKKEGANYTLETNGKKYTIKLLFNKKDCDLQINNIDTWVVFNGKSYNSVADMTLFMNIKKENRIVILCKKAKTIKKVINESEMIMVKPDVDVYGVKVLNNNEIDYLFK